jgi:hypothetical protein
VVNGVRRHAEPLGDNDPPQLKLLWALVCAYMTRRSVYIYAHLRRVLSDI